MLLLEATALKHAVQVMSKHPWVKAGAFESRPTADRIVMAVDIQRKESSRTRGRFGWDGGFGTSASADPAEGMIGILFTQGMMDSPEPPKVFSDFWTLAYGAME